MLHSRAQCLTVSPGSIWAGGTIHVIQKADGWTEQSTGLPYAAADAKSGVSGTYTFPQFGDGGLTIIETQYYYSDEKIYYLTGPPGTYDITAGTETVRVHIVDINAIQTTPADPIKIGDPVNFSVTTNPSDLDGDPLPSTVVWEGEVSGANLTASSTWTTGGHKAVAVHSDGIWSGLGSLGGVYQSTIVTVYELTGLTVDKEFPDADEIVTWTATVMPDNNHPEVVAWTAGWITATTTGLTHTRSFLAGDFPGSEVVAATCGTSTLNNTIRLERVGIASIAQTAQFVGGPAWTLDLVNSSTDVLWQFSGPTATPEQENVASFSLNPGAEPGKFTVSVSVKIDGAPPKTVSVDLTAVRVTVKEASLVSSGSGFAVVLDDNGSPYSRPLWTPAMDPPNVTAAADVVPVQYQRNGRVAMDAKFTVEPSDWSGTVKVKAIGEFTLEQKDFPAAGGELVVAALNAESTALLPNIVDWQKNKSCSWQCSVDGGTHFGDAKNSRHAYYTTLNPPSLERRTVVHLACKKTGATDEHTAVMNAWDSFNGTGVLSWNDLQLKYWEGSDPTDNAYSLIVDRDGRCGAWAKLLMKTFAVHGIAGTNPKRQTITPHDPRPRPFLQPTPAYGFHIFSTIPGQNNASPHFAFVNHVVVKYTHDGTEYLMDPSYGRLRDDIISWLVELAWENDSIEWYVWSLLGFDRTEANSPTDKGVRFDDSTD